MVRTDVLGGIESESVNSAEKDKGFVAKRFKMTQSF